MYKEKYLKYKNKYLDLKKQYGSSQKFLNIIENIPTEQLQIKLNLLYNELQNNNFYNKIYNKFIYLPIKDNIQIVLKYYPIPECSQLYNPITDNCFYQIDSKNNDEIYRKKLIKKSDYYGYFRNENHLKNMFNEDYYNFITLDNFSFGTKNITLPNKNINPIPYFIWKDYKICPTIDPVHINHIILVHNNARAQELYFPTKETNILRDMFDFSLSTNQYVYNSIELGSIPEYAHFHTSNEIPPLNNITKMVENSIPLYHDNLFKIYKIDNLQFKCHTSYYFEIENEGISTIVNDLPKILFDSLYLDGYKYMAQIFILPKILPFNRLVIIFRRVSTDVSIPKEDGKYDERYYDSLFGQKVKICYGKNMDFMARLRYNILGYEPILYNITNNTMTINFEILENAKEYCFTRTHELLNDYCNIFHHNSLFEKHINKIITENKLSKRIYNNILKYDHNTEQIVYEIDNIKKIFNLNDTIFIGEINNDVYCFEKIAEKTISMNIDISNKVYNKFPLFMSKIIGIIKYRSEHYIVRKNISSTLKTIINLNDIKYLKYFYGLILYQLYILYNNYNLVFENLSLDDILIVKVPNNIKSFIGIRYSRFNKFILDYDKYKNNVSILTNFHKCKIAVNEDNYYSYLNDLKKIISGFNDNKINLTPMKLSDKYIELDFKYDLYYNSATYWNLNMFIQKLFDLSPKNSFEYLINSIKNNKDIFINYLNQFNTIKIPKGTKFVMGSKIQNLTNDKNFLLDKTWFFDNKQTQWFTSNFDLSIFRDKLDKYYDLIGMKGLDGCNADWYSGLNPFNLGRHFICESIQDLNFKVLSFDLLKRKIIHVNLIVLLFNIFKGKDEHKLLDIDSIDYDLNNHSITKILSSENNMENGKIKIKEDEIITFILEVLHDEKLIDFDGYIGIDYIHKNRILLKPSTTTEYVIFNPSTIKLLSIFHYDYEESKYKLYRNINDWNEKLEYLLWKYKNIDKDYEIQYNNKFSNIEKIGEIKGGERPPSYIVDVFNYMDINKYYLENIKFITSDKIILKNNDFWDGDASTIIFEKNIML
jgi:hypothetical protein